VPPSKLTRPEDFTDVFRREGVVVVGGHAVNLWASCYAPGDDLCLDAAVPPRAALPGVNAFLRIESFYAHQIDRKGARYSV